MSSHTNQINQTDIVVQVANCIECEKSLAMLQIILDEEASETDKTVFFKHLETCPKCRACYENDKQLRAVIKSKANKKEVPEDLIICIQNRIRNQKSD